MVTTIQIDEALKDRLDKLKIHHRETYNELILRLANLVLPESMERISLIETIDVLSDPEIMSGIYQALKNVERGELVDFEELKKELNLHA